MQVREKLGKSRNTVSFQWFVAPEGRKVGSLKRRVRSQLARWEMNNCTPFWREAHLEVKMCKTPQCRTTFGSWDVEKMHAVVARSTLGSQNVKSTRGSDHLWKFRCRFASLHYTTLHYTTLHHTTTTTTTTQLHSTTLHYTKLHYTTLHSTTLHSTTLHYITLHSTTLQLRLHNYTPLHYTKLHYTTRHYTTRHYIPLNSTTLHYTEWHCTTDRQVDRQTDR